MNNLINLTIGGKTKRSTTGQHPVVIDWNELPDASQAFIITYGLKQYLADGMAGAETEADAKAGVERRVVKLKEADFTRTASAGFTKEDTEQGRALKLARAAIRTALKAANKTADKEQVNAAAAKLVENNPKFLADAKKQLAAEQKAKEDLGDIDLSELLGTVTDEEEGDDE